MKTELLRLFNSVLVTDKTARSVEKSILERTIKNGYILHPAIKSDAKLLGEIEKVIGISGEKANAAFHKSWAKIQDCSDFQLRLEQVIHYFTTYGYEDLGIYSSDTVYIPDEVLEIPEVESVPLTVVKAMTSEEILGEIVELGSGIALAKETLDDMMVIIEGCKFDSDFVEKISNRELKALLYDLYRICPSEPVEYLRYLISKLTDESLLIKNNALIEKIKVSNSKLLDELIKSAPDNLASIFLRFKPLFLAMKSISRNKTFFNRLRKQANKLHEPMPGDYLNSVTSHIKNHCLSLGILKKKLKSASIFRKIRLAYALNFRMNSPESIVYRVRNGSGWAADFEWAENLGFATSQVLEIVTSSICDDVRENVEGKTIYIPENLNYALPATEKQFTGNFPTGSYVSVSDDLIVGIHWENTETGRVDIDLSLLDAKGKIGWDGGYRTKDRSILFSGDVTDAPRPKGATELFYCKNGNLPSKLLVANYFNFNANDPVPCKIIVAQEKVKKFHSNYMVDPNNIVALANIHITKKEKVLGLLIHVNGENRVYFAKISIGGGISSSYDPNSERIRQYLVSSLVNSLSLKSILVAAGANVVDKKPSGDFIDLSSEALDKTTITKIIKPKGAKKSETSFTHCSLGESITKEDVRKVKVLYEELKGKGLL